jgi:hypothetical protein
VSFLPGFTVPEIEGAAVTAGRRLTAAVGADVADELPEEFDAATTTSNAEPTSEIPSA